MKKSRIAQPLSQKSTVPLLPLRGSSVCLSVLLLRFDLPHSLPVLPFYESFLETFSLRSSDLPFFTISSPIISMDSPFEREFAHTCPPSPLQSLNSHQYPSKSELKSNRAPSANTTSGKTYESLP